MAENKGLTLIDYISGVRDGSFSPQEVYDSYMSRAREQNKYLNSYISFTEEERPEGESLTNTQLCGAPIAVKDLILTEGYTTTCGSKMLENYIAPYSATCYTKLRDAGGAMVGKTNMDEYAMGTTNENSAFGAVRNPHGIDRVPGGSSGGSAAAVASDCAIAALGTDTGGSIRMPASVCGVVGVKPTYGRVSRYGVQSMASSFDQVGVFTKTVDDAALLLSTISGHDHRDMTSSDRGVDSEAWGERVESLQGARIAVPKEFFGEGLSSNIKELLESSIEKMKSDGALVEEISLPLLKKALSIYYILVPAEASSNLARFDGIKYGHALDTHDYDSIYAYYAKVREEALGEEPTRRIAVGSYVLRSGYYDAYYRKAAQARAQLCKEFDAVYENYDLIFGPAFPTAASKLGVMSNDPLQAYLSDIYTVPLNLVGAPGMSLPLGYVEEGDEKLPVGGQLFAKRRDEATMFRIARRIETVMNV